MGDAVGCGPAKPTPIGQELRGLRYHLKLPQGANPAAEHKDAQHEQLPKGVSALLLDPRVIDAIEMCWELRGKNASAIRPRLHRSVALLCLYAGGGPFFGHVPPYCPNTQLRYLRHKLLQLTMLLYPLLHLRHHIFRHMD
jgi:hypothetical protein